MKRIAMFVAPLVALVLALTYSQALRAADVTATGTVSVTVTDKDGKPVEGATVRITAHKPGGKNAGATANLADAPTTRPAPVAEGKTDAEGKAKLENVAAGDYNLSANLKALPGPGLPEDHREGRRYSRSRASAQLRGEQRRTDNFRYIPVHNRKWMARRAIHFLFPNDLPHVRIPIALRLKRAHVAMSGQQGASPAAVASMRRTDSSSVA